MHFAKFTISQVGALLKHYERLNKVYSNDCIEPSKTAQNYNLCKDPIKSQAELKNILIEQCESLKGHLKSNAIAMVDLCITLPQDEPDEKAFFKACYEYLDERFGNTINASVHLDETTPHLHYAFAPITFDNRLCAKQIVCRSMLRSFHQEMEKVLSEKLGHEVHLLNGATSEGHKTTLELKIKDLENKKEKLLNELIDIKDKQLNLSNDYNRLIDKFEEDKEKSKNILSGIENYIEVKKNEIPKLDNEYQILKTKYDNLNNRLNMLVEKKEKEKPKMMSVEEIKNKYKKPEVKEMKDVIDKIIPSPVKKKPFDRGR